ncbi:MAG: hypothetical protein DMD54_16835 [Gemmatimonadetes bacterium]|nr:MAG: hypothetical protein DMD54_16835 [Gemmatimonadota bacterium]
MDKTILLAVLFGSLAHGPLAAQTGSVSGSGSAAAVATTVSTQQFASAALPSAGGMTDSELASIAVLSTVSADGLASITTGQLDEALVSATTTAQAANVNVLNGLITADAVLAMATSYANGVTATSESDGSALVGLVVNGVSYADVPPDPNTQVDLPGVGYVVLNEQLSDGDGVHNTSLTVNMIHVYLTDPTGAPAGDIVIGTARSGASL